MLISLCPSLYLLFLFRYKGTYCSQEVAIKVLKPERLDSELEKEFAQEVFIMRFVCLLVCPVVILCADKRLQLRCVKYYLKSFCFQESSSQKRCSVHWRLHQASTSVYRYWYVAVTMFIRIILFDITFYA